MSMFKRFVEPGRLALITFGPCAGKMYLGVDSLGRESFFLVFSFFSQQPPDVGFQSPRCWGEIFQFYLLYIYIYIYIFFFFGGPVGKKHQISVFRDVCLVFGWGGSWCCFFLGLVDGGVSFFCVGGAGGGLFFYGEYTRAAKR